MLVAVTGDRQAGAPNRTLSVPITVRVVDELGHARPDTPVHWSADDGGSIAPPVTSADADGEAHATWTLGPDLGVQHATASSDGYADIMFSATASDATYPDAPIIVLSLKTSDGSGQTVHPDFVAMAAPWTAAARYLVLTPYPNGNANFENPSLFAGSDAVTWAPPSGVQNPIASPNGGYLSDPDAVYLADQNQLRVYYRGVDAHNVIRMISSTDGVHFAKPVTVAQGDDHTIVSPTVVRRSATDWLMWAVNSNVGCGASKTTVELRRSTNGVDWSAPSTVTLSQPGYSVWHIDVQWIPSRNEYWALYNAKTAGSCTTLLLYLATSPDGMTWTTYPSPVLAFGAILEFDDIVYRSTFAYDADADVIDFWYSGARYISPNYIWSSAYQRRARGDVFATIVKTPNRALASRAPRPGVPPLLDPP